LITPLKNIIKIANEKSLKNKRNCKNEIIEI
jgi:hypothetical protein